MNWTEGNLSRHSKSKQRNDLLARQKQHFAKVRNGFLKNGPKQSPISISFLEPRHPRASAHDDYSAEISRRSPSTPLLTEKRKRTKQSRNSPQSQSSIREKRRRLLDKTDWVGLDLQQPIDITFPGQHQPANGSRWSRVDRPRVHTMQRIRKPRSSPRFEAPSPAANVHPLRIQIGNQVIHPSRSTTFQLSPRRYSLVPHHLASSSLRSNTLSSPAPSHARQLYVTGGDNSEAAYVYGGQRGRKPRDHGGAYFKAPPAKPLTAEAPARIAYASSIIYNPAPVRKHGFNVLGWSPSSSIDRRSMQVEIERPSRPVPLSQNADQERWRRLASGSSDCVPDGSSMDSQAGMPLSDSSASTLSARFQRELPNHDVSSDLGFGTIYLDPGLTTSSRSEEVTQPAAVEVDDQVLESRQGLNEPQKEAVRKKIIQKEIQKEVQKEIQKKIQPVDDNAAWMKLVFDGDSDELEEKAFEEAARQAAAELHPSESSTGFVDAVESVAEHETSTPFDQGREPSEITSLETSSESRMATHGTAPSESVPSDEATAGSTQAEESKAPFRFAIPRTFVGKLVDSNATAQRPPVLSHGGKRRGRSKKKAVDGRTDIRGLPGFDGDPIEEFDED